MRSRRGRDAQHRPGGEVKQTAVRAPHEEQLAVRPQRYFLASLVSEAMGDCARSALWARPTVVSEEHGGRPSGQGSEWLEVRHAPVLREESAHPRGRKADTSSEATIEVISDHEFRTN